MGLGRLHPTLPGFLTPSPGGKGWGAPDPRYPTHGAEVHLVTVIVHPETKDETIPVSEGRLSTTVGGTVGEGVAHHHCGSLVSPEGGVEMGTDGHSGTHRKGRRDGRRKNCRTTTGMQGTRHH